MIIRTEKNSHYTTICNDALNDPKLSLKAKGLWAFIMSKPDEWNLSSRGLEVQLKEGRDAIMAALKELEKAGYLERGKKRLVNGRWSTGVNTLYEQPTVVGKSVHGKLDRGKPHHIVSTKQVSTKQDIDSKESMVAEATCGYGNIEVNSLLSFWATTTGVPIQRQVKRNREACHTLLKTEGIEKLRELVQAVASKKGDRYFPVITDFISLEFKLDQVKTHIDRNSPAPVYPNVGAMLHPEKYGRPE